MSTKFFNNIDATLLDKFHGIASAMANFDIFHAVFGYFRSSGYSNCAGTLSIHCDYFLDIRTQKSNLYIPYLMLLDAVFI